MRTYGRLLRRPSTAAALLAALLSAVPIGMWPLTVVLIALADGGDAARAGLLAAVFGVGNALGVITQGALLLRVRAVLLLPAFALLGAPAAVLLRGDGALAVAGALLAGLAIPAVTPAVRGRFASVLPGDDRPGAYALVNVLFQAGIAIGPVLTAAMATAGRIGWAPPVAAAVGLGSAVLLAVAHRRAPRPERIRAALPHGAGSSRRGVLALVGCSVAAGFGIGVLQVLLPVRSGATVSGAAFAALALAEVGGAVLLGARVRARHAPRMLVGGSAAMAVVYLALAAGPVPAVLLAVVLGAATAVQSLGSALLLDRFVSAARLPAVFATQVAALVLASAVGAFVAGLAAGAAPVLAAVLLAAAASAALLVLLAPPRGRLVTP